MTRKHEWWTFEFEGSSNPMTMGPIEMGRPVTSVEITKYIKRKYETDKNVKVYPHVPWWA